MIYLPKRKVIRLDGWYNDRQGTIASYEMPLGEFLRGPGISLEDCREALDGVSTPTMPSPTMSAEHSPRTMAEEPVVPAGTTGSSAMAPMK